MYYFALTFLSQLYLSLSCHFYCILLYCIRLYTTDNNDNSYNNNNSNNNNIDDNNNTNTDNNDNLIKFPLTLRSSNI